MKLRRSRKINSKIIKKGHLVKFTNQKVKIIHLNLEKVASMTDIWAQ